jgi:hypothetical protein
MQWNKHTLARHGGRPILPRTLGQISAKNAAAYGEDDITN